MDYEASQTLARMLDEVEPEDAIQMLIAALRNYDSVTVRVITRDDVLGQIDEYHPEHNLTDEERSGIASIVQRSYGWTLLAQADEDVWDLLNGEIQDAAHTLGLSLD